jgi:hypothetical protein
MKIYNGSIALTKIKSSRFKTPKGADCLLIPLDQPGVFVSDKGAVYLNTSIILSDEKDKFGNEGSISLSQTKEQREAKEEKVYLGNLKKVFDNSTVNEVVATKPTLEQRMESVQPDTFKDDFSDLPF